MKEANQLFREQTKVLRAENYNRDLYYEIMRLCHLLRAFPAMFENLFSIKGPDVSTTDPNASDHLHSTNLSNIKRPDGSTGITFYREVRQFEISLIEQSLMLTHGNQRRSAEMLNLKPTTLNQKNQVVQH